MLVQVAITATSAAQTFNERIDFDEALNPEVGYSIEVHAGQLLVQSALIPNEELRSGLILLDPMNGDVLDQFMLEHEHGTFSSGLSNCVQEVNTGGYIIAHSFRHESSPDFVQAALLRLDEDLDTMWTRQFGVDSVDVIGYSVVETEDNGFALTGTTGENSSIDIFVIKVDSDGNFLWKETYGTDCCQDLAASITSAPENGLVVGAFTRGLGGPDRDRYVIRLDSVGNQLWDLLFDTIYDFDDDALRVLRLPDDTYVGCGMHEITPADESYPYVVRFDDEGEIIWEEEYTPDPYVNAWFSSIKQLEDGDLVACGAAWYPWELDGEAQEGILAKISTENGELQWMRRFYNVFDNHCYFRDVIECPDGGLAMCGYALGSGNLNLNQDTWVVKTDEWGCIIPGCHVGLEELSDSKRLKLHPNPVSVPQSLFLTYPQIQNGEVRVFNSLGREIVRKSIPPGSSTMQIAVQGLARGVYVVSAQDYEGQKYSTRFIVN